MTSLIQFSDQLEALVAKASPAVVGVEHGRGQGSGFILASDGYVLTNNHVVDGATSVRAHLWQEDPLRAEVVGSDPATDLAVLSVGSGSRRLASLPLAEPGSINVGQVVVAIGNLFRFERSVSVGIVSALDRTLPGRHGPFEGLIQTDAAINPGNSGGPLVNARGEVVGINTAVVPFAQGIGFAVPARTAAWVASVLLQQGHIPRRYLGVAARSEELSAALRNQLGQRRGVRILRVVGQSPATDAGLRVEDLLVGMNGRPVESVDDVQRTLVLNRDPVVTLDLWRAGKKHLLTARPADATPQKVAA